LCALRFYLRVEVFISHFAAEYKFRRDVQLESKWPKEKEEGDRLIFLSDELISCRSLFQFWESSALKWRCKGIKWLKWIEIQKEKDSIYKFIPGIEREFYSKFLRILLERSAVKCAVDGSAAKRLK
jgi:hypothetical protein